MIEASRRWLRRHRNKLFVGAGIIGAGYFAGQYVLGKIQEARQRMSEDRIAKENLRRRFAQNQDDCTYTVLALIPTVRDEIIGALPVEQITEQLQQERQDRLKRLGASEAASSDFPSAPPSAVDDDGRSLASLQSSGFVHASQIAQSSGDIAPQLPQSPRPKRSKAQLWQDMKINSITRALSLIYTLSLLTLLTRIQLNLLGRRTYLSSVVALASPPAPAYSSTISLENRDDDNYDNVYGSDFETNRKYLTFSWWLLHRGSKMIMQRVMAAVKEVFGAVNIREDISLERLADLIMQVRKKVEGATEEERRSMKWLDYLLPPGTEEAFVIRQAGLSEDEEETPSPEAHSLIDPMGSKSDLLAAPGDAASPINHSLRRLLDETSDLIESPTCAYVLTRMLDTAFSHLVDYRIATEAYKVSAPPAPGSARGALLEPRITEISDAKCKLAHVLPAFCKQAHVIAVGSGELDALAGVAAQEGGLGNEYLEALDRVHDLEAFAAVIYSSNFEYEVAAADHPPPSSVPSPSATAPSPPLWRQSQQQQQQQPQSQQPHRRVNDDILDDLDEPEIVLDATQNHPPPPPTTTTTIAEADRTGLPGGLDVLEPEVPVPEGGGLLGAGAVVTESVESVLQSMTAVVEGAKPADENNTLL